MVTVDCINPIGQNVVTSYKGFILRDLYRDNMVWLCLGSELNCLCPVSIHSGG